VVDLNYQYVNCWEDHTRFKTLYRLLDGIESTFDIHRQKTTDKLTKHQQVLYETIKEKSEIGAGDLYDAYCEDVDDPKTRRTMRNHLSKLEQYNLIFASGKTKARTYQPYS